MNSNHTETRNKYQLRPDVLEQLQEEGFNTELIKPERRPTFDEIAEQLKTKSQLSLVHSANIGTYTLGMITCDDFYELLQTLKLHILTSNVIDDRVITIIRFRTVGSAFSKEVGIRDVSLIGINNGQQHQHGTPIHRQIEQMWNELDDIIKFGNYTIGRLNKTINAVEMISSDIITQGCELTDHRTRLDLISEEVDSNAQDIIKHERLYTSQYNALQTKVSLLETSTTTTTTTTHAHSREIQNIITRITENETLMEVMTANIDTSTQTNDLLLFQYRQLDSIYLQLEERVSKMEATQKTDIQTMYAYITKLNKSLANMYEREEKYKYNMRNFENKINMLETDIKYLAQYSAGFIQIVVTISIIGLLLCYFYAMYVYAIYYL